ncbi:UDP-N-acetylmuramoyl-L-alanyl-D-glutamate--2,6-diaminopimelate ligase [Pontimonas salivibrio]|uniref:UDP-N-acetylmuramoyl-L-alanyl-D-glutamate--2, 6-diaminopimelate ligase n=1 Tax=Pontimonas salivibrio TaxID=1159327 RepID=A0A2L2BQK4_9MICO|nr:UDP-N-acetylmuramoyl-L-alanyl-D-glutamate--2,6-diaminopimelate ligase [Pontimonas salivibrio]AVG23944.1 UDP-N-acetylmuramoyl-L-alanyl-D-glutamate--2,6-diaminopimelate ligase [Pontimonas salivibrio]
MSQASPRPTTSTPKALADLADVFSWEWLHQPGLTRVSGVALASDAVCEGDLFVALSGSTRHGAEFAEGAIAAGAVALLTDPQGAALLSGVSTDFPIAVHPEPRSELGLLSQRIYDPGVSLPDVFSVTGTNGKTSVVFFLDAIARALHVPSAFSNTHERRIGDESVKTPLTTPEAPELQALLALAAERGVSVMAIEASAQAIQRQRLTGIISRVAGFTNLSHDHLEDYGDMESYFETKRQLFQPRLSQQAVISLESEWGRKMLEGCGVPAVSVGQPDQNPTWSVEVHGVDGAETVFALSGPEGTLSSSVRAVGDYMVRNAALALVMFIQAGYTVDALEKAVGLARGGIELIVPGRLEKVSRTSPIEVFVDAGRSPDAYQKTLETLANQSKGKMIVICGTSGNRDRTKRSAMGKIAARFADYLIVADDDPRKEDPAQIRADLLEGVKMTDTPYEEIPSQEEAIARAVTIAKPGDTVVWMGPGSQSYRDVGGVREPFSARTEALRALERSGYLESNQEEPS